MPTTLKKLPNICRTTEYCSSAVKLPMQVELLLLHWRCLRTAERMSWTFEEVDAKLEQIMINIYHNIDDAAKRYGMEGNYVAGANIAGFEKVANAMIAQGIF